MVRGALVAVLCCGSAVLAGPAVRIPASGECRALVVVMPRDGWRLTIDRDGSARINYAALPQTVRTDPGTFSFEDVYPDVVTRLRTSCANEEAGTIDFITTTRPDQAAAWCFTDEAYGAALFEQAWARSATPAGEVGGEHYALLRSMWERR